MKFIEPGEIFLEFGESLALLLVGFLCHVA